MSEIELHRKLLGDAPRNRAFHQALQHHIKPGKTTIADLGAGTGFLSFLARQLGAAHCTLVEYTDTLQLAMTLARRNRIDGLSFVQGHSGEVKRPPKCDVVVSETLGNYALEEGMLETLNDARRWLKAGGALIPCGLKQWVLPVITPKAQQAIDIWSDIGFDLDLSPARAASLNNMYVRDIAPDELADAALAKCWDEMQFDAKAEPLSSLRRQSLHWSSKILGEQTVYGYALWWEAELAPGVVLSTSPWAEATHWQQVYLPLLTPITLAAGETLELTLTHDSRPEVGLNVAWRSRHLRDGKPLSLQEQDLQQGRW